MNNVKSVEVFGPHPRKGVGVGGARVLDRAIKYSNRDSRIVQQSFLETMGYAHQELIFQSQVSRHFHCS